MSNQSYADFSQGKNCIVCNASANVTSMGVQYKDERYVAPVCIAKECRRDARMNNGDVIEAAFSANPCQLMKLKLHGNSIRP